MANKPTRVAVFGGTFDPFTFAHKAIVDEIFRRNLADHVVIAPTVVDYYRTDKTKWLGFLDRIKVISLFMKAYDPSKVHLYTNEIWRLLDLSSAGEAVQKAFAGGRRFLHSLLDIREKYVDEFGQDAEYSFVIGTDSYNNFKSWFCWEQILTLADMIVVSGRDGEPMNPSVGLDATIIDLPSTYLGISATKVRQEYKGKTADDYCNDVKSRLNMFVLHTPIFDLFDRAEVKPGFRPVAVAAPDWVTMIVEQDGEFLCVRQLRYGLMKPMTEFVCGMVDANEDSRDAAVREMKEELGIALKTKAAESAVDYLGTLAANPAFMTNHMHYYYISLDELVEGRDYEQVEQTLDEHEDVSIVSVSKQYFLGSLKEEQGSSLMAAGLFFLTDKEII